MTERQYQIFSHMAERPGDHVGVEECKSFTQCPHDKRFDNSSCSRLLEIQHPSTRHRYSYSFKEKAHRVTKLAHLAKRRAR